MARPAKPQSQDPLPGNQSQRVSAAFSEITTALTQPHVLWLSYGRKRDLSGS